MRTLPIGSKSVVCQFEVCEVIRRRHFHNGGDATGFGYAINHPSVDGWRTGHLRSYHGSHHQWENGEKSAGDYAAYTGYAHLAAVSMVGMSSLAAGLAIGIVGDAGVRANAQQQRHFVELSFRGHHGVPSAPRICSAASFRRP